MVTVDIQPEGEDCLSLVISGNTWNYRERLDACGVGGAYFKDPEGGKKYFRALKGVNVSDEEGQERVLQLLGDRVFNNLAVRVRVACDDDAEIEEGTAVADFVDVLKQRRSCHFAK